MDDETHKQVVARVLADRQHRPEILAQMKQRQQRGWEVARQSARILKVEFAVKRVVLT